MARHAAVQGHWESLRLSFSGLIRAGAAGFVIVASAVLVFGFWDERYVLGQPDERAVVRDTVGIGDIGSGRSTCAGVEVRLLVSRPRPDLPEPNAKMRACEGDYRPGEDVTIRRVPGHPDRTYGDPLSGVGFVLLSLIAGGAAAVLTAVGAVVSAMWEERTWLRRRR